ncbi:substrate-binding domain-containing protein [Microbacterium invictum]|uniref:Substrate-binding domain-containing protein n=1 Tax=Microbacterium invictum TaxID=515415 RepID=A0ABZ0VCS8_9MICO|nr:substrate-binding domain-containing protein [Microbacterium invictum]WQB70698.1 substrate-binding domain-containing protein [Microbacterium invictum]
MLVSERRDLLVERLRRHGRVDVGEAARELGVSAITIRRDLNVLSEEGHLLRVHGGALRVTAGAGARRKSVVGVVLPAADYYFAEIIDGIRSVADSLNVRLLLGVSSVESARRDPVRRLLAMGAEALLVTPPTRAAPDVTAEWMLDADVPTVVVERAYVSADLPRAFDQVRTDHTYGAKLAAHHFASHGHRSLALLLASTPTSPWLERGIASASEELGLETVQIRSIPSGEERVERVALAAALDDALAQGVTAFLVHNDFLALRLVDIVLERGLRIPDDVKVIAYDDVLAAMAPVSLSAVTPPRREVGSAALELLVRRLREGTAAPRAVQHVALLPRLQERESCCGRGEPA